MGWTGGVVRLVVGRVGLDGLRLGRCVQGDFLWRCLPAARALCRRGATLLALIGQGRFEGGARLVLEFVMGEAGVAEQDSSIRHSGARERQGMLLLLSLSGRFPNRRGHGGLRPHPLKGLVP